MTVKMWAPVVLSLLLLLSSHSAECSLVIFQLNGTLRLNHTISEFNGNVLKDLDAESIGILREKINAPVSDYELEIVNYRTSSGVTLEAVYRLRVRSETETPLLLQDLDIERLSVSGLPEVARTSPDHRHSRGPPVAHILPAWFREDRVVLIILAASSTLVLFFFIVIIACCVRVRQLGDRLKKHHMGGLPRSVSIKAPVKKGENEIIKMYVQKELKATKESFKRQQLRSTPSADSMSSAADSEGGDSAMLEMPPVHNQYPSASTVLTGISETPARHSMNIDEQRSINANGQHNLKSAGQRSGSEHDENSNHRHPLLQMQRSGPISPQQQQMYRSRPTRNGSCHSRRAVDRPLQLSSASFAAFDIEGPKKAASRRRYDDGSVSVAVSSRAVSMAAIDRGRQNEPIGSRSSGSGSGEDGSRLRGNYMRGDREIRTSQIRLSNINLEEVGKVTSVPQKGNVVWAKQCLIQRDGDAHECASSEEQLTDKGQGHVDKGQGHVGGGNPDVILSNQPLDNRGKAAGSVRVKGQGHSQSFKKSKTSSSSMDSDPDTKMYICHL